MRREAHRCCIYAVRQDLVLQPLHRESAVVVEQLARLAQCVMRSATRRRRLGLLLDLRANGDWALVGSVLYFGRLYRSCSVRRMRLTCMLLHKLAVAAVAPETYRLRCTSCCNHAKDNSRYSILTCSWDHLVTQ